MIYMFPETEKANERAKEILEPVKEVYNKPQMTKEQLENLRQVMQKAKEEIDSAENNIKRKVSVRTRWRRFAVTAAAFVAVFIILPNTSASAAYAMGELPVIGELVKLVTFREYKYEDDRHMANVEVPELILTDIVEENVTENDKLEKSAKEINKEIQEITDNLIHHFEKYVEDDMNYLDIDVKSEVLATTQGYFSLKLLCYQGAGSGYQWNYYYTIDLSTGERLALKDLFVEGADYITPISENIKEQMDAQMEADENVYYWLDDEIEEWNFKSITENTSFYLNEAGNIVIGFNEGDVAPMYMGAVEFEIPAGVLAHIWKNK